MAPVVFTEVTAGVTFQPQDPIDSGPWWMALITVETIDGDTYDRRHVGCTHRHDSREGAIQCGENIARLSESA